MRRVRGPQQQWLFGFLIILICRWDMSTAAVLTAADYIAKACVQRAVARPTWVPSILSFFFGVDYSNHTEFDQMMKQGACLHSMTRIWYGADAEYDKLCQTFRESIRVAGRGELLTLEENHPYQNKIDGVMAEMLLCDQFARNAFRGSEEAYAYENQSLASSRRLTEVALSPSTCPSLTGEIYPPYLSFMVVALMHSEFVKDHENCLELLQHAKEKTPAVLAGSWDYQIKFAMDHKEVVDRFGRYPHRNHLKRRFSTPEEDAWLSDVDNLPGWAKGHLKQ